MTGCAVVVAFGGCVGVIVMVLTSPVTVKSEVIGVGVHDETSVVEGVDEVEGVEDVNWCVTGKGITGAEGNTDTEDVEDVEDVEDMDDVKAC